MGFGIPWEQWEKDIVVAVYPTGGAQGTQARLPHRTLKAIRTMAQHQDVICTVPQGAEKRTLQDFTNLPTTNLLEQLDCARLRKWRGPVMAGPLMPILGNTMPILGKGAA